MSSRHSKWTAPLPKNRRNAPPTESNDTNGSSPRTVKKNGTSSNYSTNATHQLILNQKRILKERIQFVPSRYSNEAFFMNRKDIAPVPGTDGCAYIILDPDILTVQQQKMHANRNDLKNMQDNLHEDYMYIDTPLPAPSHFLFSSEKLNSAEMMRWNKNTTIPVIGMFNMKNTCFVNSVLQCLLYTTPLVSFMAHTAESVPMEYDPKRKFNAVHAFSRLWRRVRNEGKKALDPEEFAHNIKIIGKDFVLGKQGDAHEFMLELIDKMEHALLEKFDGSLDRRTSETNVVHQIFGGYLRSQIKSCESRFSSNTYDPFIDLSVSVLDNNSVEEGLRQYVEPCNLDGDNKYYNARSKKYETATQTITIHQAPPILMLHLKRFSETGRKISKHIHYPEILNLTPYMSVQDESHMYELYATLVHSGRASGSGHYYCFVKTSADVWYKLDDSKSYTSNITQVLKEPAYILFYRKIVRDSPMQPSPGTPFSAVGNGSSHATPKALFEEALKEQGVTDLDGATDSPQAPLRGKQRRGSSGSNSDAKYKQNKPTSLQIPADTKEEGGETSDVEKQDDQMVDEHDTHTDQINPILTAHLDMDQHSDIDDDEADYISGDDADQSPTDASLTLKSKHTSKRSTNILGSFDPNAAEQKARSSKYHQTVETWDETQNESTIREYGSRKRHRDELDETLDRGKLKKKRVKEEWNEENGKEFQRVAKRLYGEGGTGPQNRQNGSRGGSRGGGRGAPRGGAFRGGRGLGSLRGRGGREGGRGRGSGRRRSWE